MPTYRVILYDGTTFTKDASGARELNDWLHECGYNPKTSKAPKGRQARLVQTVGAEVSAVGTRL